MPSRSQLARSQLDGAMNQAQAALRISPRDLEIHHTVGAIYERMHKFEEAAVAFGNYVNLLPNKDRSEKADWSRAGGRSGTMGWVNADQVAALSALLGPSGWLERTQEFADALRASARTPGRLLLVVRRADERGQSHCRYGDDEATRRGLGGGHCGRRQDVGRGYRQHDLLLLRDPQGHRRHG